MKNSLEKYLHFVLIILLVLVFSISSYYLIINIFHNSSMNKKVYVSESDVYYKKYKNNIMEIKENLSNYQYNKNIHKYDYNTMNSLHSKIKYCYNILNSNDNGLVAQSYLSYNDVNNLNNWFINSYIDKCFTTNLLSINNLSNSKLKQQFINSRFSIDILTNNSLYIRDELKDNSSYYYNTNYFNTKIRNNLESSYQFILHNYSDFSNIILELSSYLVRGEKV